MMLLGKLLAIAVLVLLNGFFVAAEFALVKVRTSHLNTMVQALRQVRRIAETGEADSAVLATATDSVFRIDAASPEEVYGHADALKPGMSSPLRRR